MQVKRVPQAKREVQQAKNLVYPRHLPREGQEEAQEQAPQHRPVVRKALRESLKKPWEGTSQESPWPARTFCKSSRANERACQMMRPWKSLLLLLERYNPNRRPSKGNFICRLNHRAQICAREGLLFRRCYFIVDTVTYHNITKHTFYYDSSIRGYSVVINKTNVQ